MIEIYTPDDWYSIFGEPKIIIADDDYIYRGEDRHKNSRVPIGFVDWQNGKIYGTNYIYNNNVKPIAYIIPDHKGVSAVYSEKDTNGYGQPTFTAKALFYIHNNTIYKTYPDCLSGGGGVYGKVNETPPTTSSSTSGAGGAGFSSILIIPLLVILPALLMFIIPENLAMITLVTGLVALGAALFAGFKNGFVFEGRILGGIGSALIAFFGFGFIWFIFSSLRGASGIAAPNEAMEDAGILMVAVAAFFANCIGNGEPKQPKKQQPIPPKVSVPSPKKQNTNKHSSVSQQVHKATANSQPQNSVIISCKVCGAKLRIPNTTKTIEVTCPKCKNVFVHKPVASTQY